MHWSLSILFLFSKSICIYRNIVFEEHGRNHYRQLVNLEDLVKDKTELRLWKNFIRYIHFRGLLNILSSYVKNVCDFSYLVWRVMYSIKRLHVVDIEENIQILALHYVRNREWITSM